MKVLVVHDRREAAEDIREVVAADAAAGDQCDVEADYQGAHRRLSTEIYDLLIIDLTIPMSVRIGGPGFEAVQMLLDDLFNTDTLNPPGDVIGITREPEMLGLVENNLGPHLMVTIKEDAEGRWRGYLRDKIAYARRSALSRLLSLNRRYDYDALIVTAMDAEMEPYGDLFTRWPSKHFDGASEFVFADHDGVSRRGIAYAIGRSGQPSAASMAQALITQYRPRLALMSGYCGGVRGKVALGDLMLFEATYAWDYGKWGEEGTPPSPVFHARPDPIDIVDSPLHHAARGYVRSGFARSERLLRILREEAVEGLDAIALHLKPVASGSAVVAADDLIARIRGLNESMWAVDMEAYGFYHAAKYTRVAKPDFLCMKAVSDFSNGDKDDRLHRVCSRLSAELVHRLLTRDWNFEARTWRYAQP